MNQGNRGTPAFSGGNYQPQPSNRQNDVQRVFFSQTNYGRILQPLREQYERKMNKPELPDEIDKRLQKTVQHYMQEVYRLQGTQLPLQNLNQEVYRETSLNMDNWFGRQVQTPVQKAPAAAQAANPIFDNVSNRFEREQQMRAPAPAQPIMAPDFTYPSNEDDEEDPLEKYERIRKIREAEMKVTPASKTKETVKNDILSEPSAPPPTTAIPPQNQNNPPPPPLLAPRQQDYIIKQDDIVKYKENELNLYVYSGDRDWVKNRNENRYNFTINFNSANTNNSGASYSPSVKERIKNITRIELVKVIMSTESIDMSIRVAGGSTDSGRIINVLSYPYLMVRINEYTGNGIGTNANIDNTFGLIQYDQAWKADAAANNFGFVAMTPRYLKAQRVYLPTPLATLQKLSISIERPDGEPLTGMLDTLDLARIYLAGSTNTSTYSTIPDTESYIFIKTKTYFSRFSVIESDTIQIRGYDVGTSASVSAQTANDMNNFINRAEGHLVVGIGYTTDSTVPISVTDGSNTVGYANYIIIRSRFADPTTGSTARDYFGGSTAKESAVQSRLETLTDSSNCALLNRNRQVHMVLRVITREMDPTSNLRPDNS